MSESEWQAMSRKLTEGLALAQYRMVRQKAERNLKVTQGTVVLPATDVLRDVYHENTSLHA